MKKKLIGIGILSLLITSSAFAQKDKSKDKDKKVKVQRVHEIVYSEPPPMFDIKNVNGKWQEIERTNAGGNKVSFNDSLMLNIADGNGFVKTTGTMDMVMRGEARIENGNVLSLAGSRYTVQTADGAQIVILEQGNRRVLKPVTSFYYEQPKTFVKKDVFETPVASVDIQKLNGKWEIFKKQAAPGFITKETRLLKWISFTNTSGEAGTGEALTYAGSATPGVETFEYRIVDGELRMKSKSGEVTTMIYKADGQELVFGKAGELLNFGRLIK